MLGTSDESKPYKRILSGGRDDDHEVTFNYDQPFFSFCSCSKSTYDGAGLYSCCGFSQEELTELEIKALELAYTNLGESSACLIKFSQRKKLAVTLFGSEKAELVNAKKQLLDCYQRSQQPLSFFKLEGLRGSDHAVIYDIGATDEEEDKDEKETQADDQSLESQVDSVKRM